jgi:hypothetical protein
MRTWLSQNAGHCGELETETRIFSPLFDQNVAVMIQHDKGRSDVSDQQLHILQTFAKLSTGLEKIKQELYRHWETVDNWGDFNYSDAEETYSNAKLLYLLIPPREKWGPDVSVLRFAVKWDVEHGAGIFIRRGVIEEFACY